MSEKTMEDYIDYIMAFENDETTIGGIPFDTRTILEDNRDHPWMIDGLSNWEPEEEEE